MAHRDALIPGFPKGSGKEILIRATFAMGIFYIAYAILWPVLPDVSSLYRAFPLIALAAFGLGTLGWFAQLRIRRRYRSGGVFGTRRRFSLSSLLTPGFPTKLVKEVLTTTILCLGALSFFFAIVLPFIPDPVRGPDWWFLLLILSVATMDRLWARRAAKRRSPV